MTKATENKTKAKTLAQIRLEINEVDEKIQNLINDRAQLAAEVAKVKINSSDDSVFYRPEREAQILRTIINRDKSLLKSESVAHIFRQIMSACLALEQPLDIAYLGPKGTFTEEAAFKHFGHAVNVVDCNTIDEIFVQVDKGNANYGIAPIENSSNGIIGNTVDMLYKQGLKICGEVEVNIHHQLMTNNKDQEIQVIYAHQQALDQCNNWLAKNYPNADLRSLASNAAAANMVTNTKNAAAIASVSALELYKLHRIAKNIEDKVGNITRFLVIGKDDVPPSDNDKTSMLVVIKHKHGALFDLLEPFKEQNINILQIARHPIPGVKWEYIFFIDVAGHRTQEDMKKALAEVSKRADTINILGSYPVAVL